MAREIHDHFFHKAKDQGYRSRAAFKLIEIDDKKNILRKGDYVLDAGCAPGSWLQVVASRVVTKKGKGLVVGIDLQAVEDNFKEENIHLVQGDFTTIPIEELYAPFANEDQNNDSNTDLGSRGFRGFDVLLSDMAPSTTGDRACDHHASIRLCNALLDRCGELLRPPESQISSSDSGGERSGGGNPGGNLVIKVFEGEAYSELLQKARSMFTKVKGFSPQASRSESTEIYLIAHGFKGVKVDPVITSSEGQDSDQAIPLPRRKPSKGWGEDDQS
ncbi:MAG: RlmE family RNA methyltransferase [Planctomycetota bacterium]|nr:RlmE family RNA methyltransferase [Planctomycetota bacterium]